MTALSLAGDLTFNPLTDALTGADGKQVKLKSPYGDELPARGFDAGEDTYQPPAADGSKVSVVVDPSRLSTPSPLPLPSPALWVPTCAVSRPCPRFAPPAIH